jgi:hypothetical protein
MEVKEGRLMLLRNNDYRMRYRKFPRLTKIEARARLKEIKRLPLAHISSQKNPRKREQSVIVSVKLVG